MKMYQQGEDDPLIKERKLRRLNSGGETETIRTKADLEAAFEAGLIETVRREAAAVFGANQTYPCGDVMAMKAEIDRLRFQDDAIRAYFGGKRDGRDTIEILTEAFHAKWSKEDTLFQAMLDHKTAELKAENERLRAALQEARDAITGWASYASDYFKDKHDLEGDLARIDEVLAGSLPAEQEKPNE